MGRGQPKPRARLPRPYRPALPGPYSVLMENLNSLSPFHRRSAAFAPTANSDEFFFCSQLPYFLWLVPDPRFSESCSVRLPSDTSCFADIAMESVNHWWPPPFSFSENVCRPPDSSMSAPISPSHPLETRNSQNSLLYSISIRWQEASRERARDQ